MPEPRRSAADRALDYVLNSEIELFQDQHSVAYISFENFLGRMERWGVNSKAAADFIRIQFFRNEAKGLSGDSLATARGTLSAHARFHGLRYDLSCRVARRDAVSW